MTLKELGYNLTERDGKYYYTGSINLSGTKITTLPNNLIVGGNLNLEGSSIITLPDNLVVGGSLFLSGTKITTLPNNLVVGGFLNLSRTKITFLPDNLIIGEGLGIQDTEITSLPEILIVGGSIYYDSTKITKETISRVNNNFPKVLFWRNKEYVKVEGLFYRVLSYKRSIYKISWIGDDKIYYLITNKDCSKYMLKNTLEEAKKNYNLLNTKR